MNDERTAGRLEFRPLLRRVLDGYRYDWKLLLGAGLVVFGPVGLLTSLDPLWGYDLEDWQGGWSIVLMVLIALQTAVPLIGAVFYSGVVAAGEEERRAGVSHTLGHVARHLPYRNLIVADIALIVVLSLGFVVLFIPGLIFLTWFALIAPLIEIERLPVRAAFRRSRRLVRPHAWRVAGVMIPLLLLQSALEGGGERLAHNLLGEGFLGSWAATTVASLLGSPLYALTVLALYFEIARREAGDEG